MTKFSNKKNAGYSILELLFYIALFVTLSMVFINSMLAMTKSFRETTVQREFVQAGTVMERISREVRQAYGINTISASALKLDTTDGAGASKTVEFLVSGANIQLLENNVLTGNLNTPDIDVISLSFAEITTAKGKAVKVSMTVRANNDTLNRNQDFYDTIVLRGNY